MQVVLRKLSGADADNRRHCIKLLRTFEYRGHLCLAFEAMVYNPFLALFMLPPGVSELLALPGSPWGQLGRVALCDLPERSHTLTTCS